MTVLFDGGTLFCCGVLLLIEATGGVARRGGTKVEDGSVLLGNEKEGILLGIEEKGVGEGVLLLGGAGPDMSQEGGEEAVLVLRIVPGWKGNGSASRCSVNVT